MHLRQLPHKIYNHPQRLNPGVLSASLPSAQCSVPSALVSAVRDVHILAVTDIHMRSCVGIEK